MSRKLVRTIHVGFNRDWLQGFLDRGVDDNTIKFLQGLKEMIIGEVRDKAHRVVDVSFDWSCPYPKCFSVEVLLEPGGFYPGRWDLETKIEEVTKSCIQRGFSGARIDHSKRGAGKEWSMRCYDEDWNFDEDVYAEE